MDNTSVGPKERKTPGGSAQDSIQQVNRRLKGMLNLAEEGDSSGSPGQQMVGPEEHRFWSPFPGPIDDDFEMGQMPNQAEKTPIPTSQPRRFRKRSRRGHTDHAGQIDLQRETKLRTQLAKANAARLVDERRQEYLERKRTADLIRKRQMKPIESLLVDGRSENGGSMSRAGVPMYENLSASADLVGEGLRDKEDNRSDDDNSSMSISDDD